MEANFKSKRIKSQNYTRRSFKNKKSLKKIVLVGNPNVGKSVMFYNLTGIYAAVSNYPGTTVEVTRGFLKIDNKEYEVIDTPGMYSLMPISEEERVARNILLEEKPDFVIHIIDAKNIDRMLLFTIQLIEAGLKVILVMNMADELEKLGKKINFHLIEEKLGIPVIEAVSIHNKGTDLLIDALRNYSRKEVFNEIYNDSAEYGIEFGIKEISKIIPDEYCVSKRSLALLLMQGDQEIEEKFKSNKNLNFESINKIINKIRLNYREPLEYIINLKRSEIIKKILKGLITDSTNKEFKLQDFLSKITMQPITGIPILILILYFGLYKIVGQLGAGILVDFMNGKIFEKFLNPFFTSLISKIIPFTILQELFTGEYGILTLGLRYAFAIILPIITVFFIVFAIIEDSGYLPRLAMLIDRGFKMIGLSGRAVIPMVLGIGCGTMATLVTRTLTTNRERIISTILLSIAIPCSAQLGVIISLLHARIMAFIIWGFVITLVFVLIGYLSKKLIPGEKSIFYIEIPPLRLPKLSNILIKTYSRITWYFKEIIPIFILASVLIYIGKITHVFELLVYIMSFPVKLIGLPPEASNAFLLGFFRRDYGAAGLYDLNKAGLLSGIQLVVSSVVLTLFLPCIAQFLMNIRERGIKMGLSIAIFTLFFSFAVGLLLNYILLFTGVKL